MSEVVVITGASTGVGRATVRAFAKRGASIAMIARDMEGLQAAAEEVKAAGGRALPLPMDVADADAVESAAERVENQRCGPVRVRVHCTTMRESGSCSNRKIFYTDEIEKAVLAGLQKHLKTPHPLKEFAKTYQEERERLASEKRGLRFMENLL